MTEIAFSALLQWVQGSASVNAILKLIGLLVIPATVAYTVWRFHNDRKNRAIERAKADAQAAQTAQLKRIADFLERRRR